MKTTQASIDKMIATRKRNKAAARARDTAWINGHEQQQHAHQHTQQQMTPKSQRPKPKAQHLGH